MQILGVLSFFIICVGIAFAYRKYKKRKAEWLLRSYRTLDAALMCLEQAGFRPDAGQLGNIGPWTYSDKHGSYLVLIKRADGTAEIKKDPYCN